MSGKKMFYPGSTGKCAPAAVVSGIGLVDERTPGRIDIHFNGSRGAVYMNSVDMAGAVKLMIQLDQEITRLAERDGFTEPSFVTWRKHRRSNATP